ncbi:MAG: cell division protein FtsL [gamma proteobacterium symbiont of Bathyaustriella thionipta]|nr:cell division protein FtsL [gamma proteobacterium symbiont of Bathyaustriella thionipta]
MRNPYVLLVIVLLVVASGLGVVHSKYKSRQLFVELQDIHKQWVKARVDWGRMQIELQTWGRQSRVDRIARTRLGMHLPGAQDAFLISARK